MKIFRHINIEDDSRKPKYIQIVDSIIENINDGNLSIGEKIPSINNLSEEFLISRDTVEKSYKILKKRKIITAVRGKGYYVTNKDPGRVKILFLVNKLSSYKIKIFNTFSRTIGIHFNIALRVYHCEESIFLDILEKSKGMFDMYVIMSHFKSENNRHLTASKKVIQAIKRLPLNKIIFLDNLSYEFNMGVKGIYQDFENDIYNALADANEKILKYKSFFLVYPDNSLYPYPRRIVRGFSKFCFEFSLSFEIIDCIYDEMILKKGDLFLTIEEEDLVNLINLAKRNNLKLGKDIGVLSYNDTSLKNLLGISVVSTDFELMGEMLAELIQKNENKLIKNEFNFIDRGSV